MQNELELPVNWNMNKFKYEFSTEKGLSITKENLQEEGIAVVNYGQIHSIKGMEINCLSDSLPFVSSKYFKKNKSAILSYGDFVFADTSEDIEGSGNFKMNTTEQDLIFAGYHSIIARLKGNNYSKYFMYLFESDWFREQIQDSVSGVKVFSITQLILKNTKIIVPPVYEQINIANYLDKKIKKIDRAIELLEQEIRKLLEYRKSLITTKVTKGISNDNSNWKLEKLKYYFTTNKGLSITRENLEDFGIPVMSYGQIHSKYGVRVNPALDELPFVNRRYLKNKTALLNYGDFIFADTSEDIEGSGNFSTNFGNELFFAGYHTIVVRLKDFVNNDFRYFMYLFDSQWFRNRIQSKVSGVKVYSITQQMLKNEEIIIPTRKEQEKIADFLETKVPKINQSIEILGKEIDILKEARKSIIFEYVTGKKRVDL